MYMYFEGWTTEKFFMVVQFSGIFLGLVLSFDFTLSWLPQISF
jgi:preprotein translocase subunit SecE